MSRLLALVLVLSMLLAGCEPRRGMPATQPQGGPGAAGEKATEPAQVGGPCEYASYAGTFTITRIEQTDASKAQAKANGGPGYEGYEVWFTFQPTDAITGAQAQSLQREQLFQLKNSWYPGPRYLDKYGLKVGQSFPATAEVITKGTCTPLQFTFDALDQADYFESQ